MDMTVSENRIQAIRVGVTPKKVEHAYQNNYVAEYARRHSMYPKEIRVLAQEWGINDNQARHS